MSTDSMKIRSGATVTSDGYRNCWDKFIAFNRIGSYGAISPQVNPYHRNRQTTPALPRRMNWRALLYPKRNSFLSMVGGAMDCSGLPTTNTNGTSSQSSTCGLAY